MCLKDRHNLKTPATVSWNKHEEKREVLLMETHPPAPDTGRGGPQGGAKAWAFPNLLLQDAISSALWLINPGLDRPLLYLEPSGCLRGFSSHQPLLPPAASVLTAWRAWEGAIPTTGPQCSWNHLTEARRLDVKVTSNIFLRERDSYFVMPQSVISATLLC